jgi:hypothetical protein
MTTEQLTNRLAARPFVPFELRMADGRTIEVTHPEIVAYRGGRVAVVMNADESLEIIDLLLVPSILVQTGRIDA